MLHECSSISRYSSLWRLSHSSSGGIWEWQKPRIQPIGRHVQRWQSVFRVVQICVHSMFTGSGHTCSCIILTFGCDFNLVRGTKQILFLQHSLVDLNLIIVSFVGFVYRLRHRNENVFNELFVGLGHINILVINCSSWYNILCGCIIAWIILCQSSAWLCDVSSTLWTRFGHENRCKYLRNAIWSQCSFTAGAIDPCSLTHVIAFISTDPLHFWIINSINLSHIYMLCSF